MPTTSQYALSIHCTDCDSRQDLDPRVTVASAEVVVFVAAHSGHDRLAFHLQLPDPAGEDQLAGHDSH